MDPDNEDSEPPHVDDENSPTTNTDEGTKSFNISE